MTKKLLSIIALLSLAVTNAWADANGYCGDPSVNEGKKVTWTLTGTSPNYTLTISGTGAMANYNSDYPGWVGYTDYISSIVIEDGVTHIGDYAFDGCSNSNLTSITIPASVTSIGKEAFLNCSALASVTFASESKLESIGSFAFDSCSGLISIEIPASVKSIGKGAFNSCSNLATITVNAGNTVYDSRNNCNAIIEKSSNTLVTGCKGSTIPASVTSIGEYAFNGSCVTSIVIPASVTSIGQYAFNYCGNLASVTVYATACTLGEGAFNNCASGLNIYVFSDKETTYENTTNWSDYADKIEAIPALTVNDAGTAGKWCTYYNGLADVTVADGTTVYTAKYNSTSKMVTLTETGSQIIKKGEAVLLKADADITLTSAASSGDGTYTGNELKGTDKPTDASGMTYAYCLSYDATGGLGFYKFTGNSNYGEIIPANRAYLIINDGGSGARSFYGFDVEEDSKTAIQAVETVGEDGEIYDLSGRRVVGQPRKGIYVKNGKKIVIK